MTADGRFPANCDKGSLSPKNRMGLSVQPGSNWRDRRGARLGRARCEPNLLHLEQTIMKKIRPRQKRSLSLEALEGRLTLSTGLAVASPHTHALVMRLTHGKIPAVFKGHVSVNGSAQVTLDLAGRIGKDQFAGNGSGTTSGTIVQSGDVYLSNSQGSLHLKLDTASVTRVRKRLRQIVPVVIAKSTGKYAQWTGRTGLLTTWKVPARPNAVSSFSGFLNG
jgi:hypothetical protein